MPIDPLQHDFEANRKKHRFEVKKLKELHAKVYPDPDEVQILRAHYPNQLDGAVWVPYVVDQEAFFRRFFFFTVCQEPESYDHAKKIRLVVCGYNDRSLNGEAAKPITTFNIFPFAPALLFELAECYRTFFDYSLKADVKKRKYTEELDRRLKIKRQNHTRE